MTNPNRQPPGLSIGGQFAPDVKAEPAGLTLSPCTGQTPVATPLPKAFTNPSFTQAVVAYDSASTMKAYADRIRQHHPDAVAVHRNSVYYMDGAAEKHMIDVAVRADPALAEAQSDLVDIAGPVNFVPFGPMDRRHSEAEQAYTKALQQAFVPDQIERAMESPLPLPYGVPEDVSIEASIDNDGDATAVLKDSAGKAAGRVWLDEQGEMNSEMYADAPDWAQDNEHEIYETLRSVALNRLTVRDHLAGTVDLIPGMGERINEFSSGGAASAPRVLDVPVDLELSGRKTANGSAPAGRASEIGLYATLNPGGNVDLHAGNRTVTLEANPAATGLPKDLEEAIEQHLADEHLLVSGDISESEANDQLASHRERVERNGLALRSLLGKDYDTVAAEFGHQG